MGLTLLLEDVRKIPSNFVEITADTGKRIPNLGLIAQYCSTGRVIRGVRLVDDTTGGFRYPKEGEEIKVKVKDALADDDGSRTPKSDDHIKRLEPAVPIVYKEKDVDLAPVRLTDTPPAPVAPEVVVVPPAVVVPPIAPIAPTAPTEPPAPVAPQTPVNPVVEGQDGEGGNKDNEGSEDNNGNE